VEERLGASGLPHLVKVLLELLEFGGSFPFFVEELREEPRADLCREEGFIAHIQATLQDEQVGNCQENFSITAFNQRCKVWILFRSSLN